MKRLAIIPARGGSKRIPRKNIKDFCGKPIIAYTIDAALKSGLFDEVMVSTDDTEIAEIAVKYGAKVPFLRSEEASSDKAVDLTVKKEVIAEYEKRGQTFEEFAYIYPCAPFITAEKLREAFALLESTDADTVLPVVRFSYPPQRCFVIRDGSLSYREPEYRFTRSQELEPLYHDAGQFAVYRTDFALGRRTGSGRTYPIVVPEETVQDIDNESDWKLAEQKYAYFMG